jgi:hypothetical protein
MLDASLRLCHRRGEVRYPQARYGFSFARCLAVLRGMSPLARVVGGQADVIRTAAEAFTVRVPQGLARDVREQQAVALGAQPQVPAMAARLRRRVADRSCVRVAVRGDPSGAIEYSSVEFASGRLRSEAKRIRLPSADQRGTPRPPSSLVSRRGCVPSAPATYNSPAQAHWSEPQVLALWSAIAT